MYHIKYSIIPNAYHIKKGLLGYLTRTVCDQRYTFSYSIHSGAKKKKS